MGNSVSVGGFGGGVDVFKAVALADGSSIVYATSFFEIAVGPMVRGELGGKGYCRPDARTYNRTNQRFRRRNHVKKPDIFAFQKLLFYSNM